ncbi:MAG: hypothetical protein DWI02_02260 [Planctomycetota bacterium]|nr:MAG: hypothetical protein DWI02_02260 [Planctomycetota bacterium]
MHEIAVGLRSVPPAIHRAISLEISAVSGFSSPEPGFKNREREIVHGLSLKGEIAANSEFR